MGEGGGEFVFVYGTLREGFRNEGRRVLEAWGEFVAVARARGRLFDAGAFPVMRVDEPGAVVGEVYALSGPGVALERLDRFEGARGDQPGPYERVKRPVELVGEARVVQAWLYAWRGSVGGFGRVKRGDYVSHVS